MKALLFDVFGTVVDWRCSIAEALRRWGEARGVEREWRAMADAWRDRYEPSMAPVRSGERAYVRLDVLHRENLDAVLNAFGLDDANDDERAKLTLAWHRLEPWPDVAHGLERLRTRHILAPVSNGNIALMVNLARHAGLPWDTVLGAEIARNYKPARDVYLKSVEALGLAPEDCMMVAAHNGDLRAASSFGLKTAFVARPTEHGEGQTENLAAEEDWDVIAGDFVDLAERLGC